MDAWGLPMLSCCALCLALTPALDQHLRLRACADMLALIQAHAAMASGLPYKYFKRQTRVNWYGSSVFFLYIVALCFYMFIRVTKTMGLGQYIA